MGLAREGYSLYEAKSIRFRSLPSLGLSPNDFHRRALRLFKRPRLGQRAVAREEPRAAFHIDRLGHCDSLAPTQAYDVRFGSTSVCKYFTPPGSRGAPAYTGQKRTLTGKDAEIPLRSRMVLILDPAVRR